MRSWLVVALSLLPCLVFAGPPDKKLSAEQAMSAGEKDFSDAEALRANGDAKGAAEKYDSAFSYFSAAHDLAPEATGPVLGMGISLAALGRCDEALPRLEDYLAKKSEGANPEASKAKEKCQNQLGQKNSVVSFRTKPRATEITLRQGETTLSLGPSPTATTLVAPGEYEVIFVQPGKDPLTRSLTLKTGDDKQLSANLKRKTLTRLSWDPGLFGLPRAFWWTSAGVVVGAGATAAIFLLLTP